MNQLLRCNICCCIVWVKKCDTKIKPMPHNFASHNGEKNYTKNKACTKIMKKKPPEHTEKYLWFQFERGHACRNVSKLNRQLSTTFCRPLWQMGLYTHQRSYLLCKTYSITVSRSILPCSTFDAAICFNCLHFIRGKCQRRIQFRICY